MRLFVRFHDFAEVSCPLWCACGVKVYSCPTQHGVKSLKLDAAARTRAVLSHTTMAQAHTLTPEHFQGPGKLQDEYVIRLQPGAQLFSLSTPRWVPLPLQDTVQCELSKFEAEEIIKPIDSPTDWCSSIAVVPKPSGDYCICVDLTRLNKVVLRERYILPSVEPILSCLSQARFFSKLNATASFHQVKLAESC